jgi:HD-GYP domain-containing protein (c-di-GMP phosphodiesterase class II)
MTDQMDWEQIFQVFPDGLMVTDRDYTIQFANSAFLHLIGKDASETVGRKCYEAFPGTLCGTTDCPLANIQVNKSSKLYNGRQHCKVEKHLPWVVTAIALKDSEGQFAGLVEKVSDAEVLHRCQSELHLNQERMRKNMGSLIQAMSTTIEKRDPYTAGHQRRVAKLCRAIATELEFSWDRIQGLRMAAAVHDLGKIVIPYAILNKSGPMSEPEMAIIRMHPGTAHDILKNIDFPWPLAETIYQHHERLDGSGYPRGLKGDEILMEARILGVADVVESMTFFRPYRPSVGLEEAKSEIEDQKGILYDPQVVDACLYLLNEKGFDFHTKTWQKSATEKAPRD